MKEQYIESSIPANHCGETPQHVDKSCQSCDSTSTTDDHLLELDSTSLKFQLQGVPSVEIEFIPEFEEHLDNNNLSQTAVFLESYDDKLFLLSLEIDMPSDHLSHIKSHVHEKLCQDDSGNLSGFFSIHVHGRSTKRISYFRILFLMQTRCPCNGNLGIRLFHGGIFESFSYNEYLFQCLLSPCLNLC